MIDVITVFLQFITFFCEQEILMLSSQVPTEFLEIYAATLLRQKINCSLTAV